MQVAVSADASAALTADARLWAWGTGKMGARSSSMSEFAPKEVAEFGDATDLACGPDHCLVRRRDGAVWGWGFNGSYRALGIEDIGPTGRADKPLQATGIVLK